MATMEANMIDIGTLIASDPKIKSGRPRIVGTGVTVQRIVRLYQTGSNADEIVRKYDGHLTLAQVYAALAYYHANRVQMDAAMMAEQQEAEQVEKEFLARRGQL